MNTVLVVEDEKAIRQGISAMVQRAPVPVERVVECRNGEEALEAMACHGADVVFTDLRMPIMDGTELVRRLNTFAAPPVIVVISGYDEFSYAQAMLREGVRDYLLKPVDRQQVYGLLSQLEAELTARQSASRGVRAAAIQVARALMQGDIPDRDTLDTLHTQYGKTLFAGQYLVACLAPGQAMDGLPEGIIPMGQIGNHEVLLAAADAAGYLDGSPLADQNPGFSGVNSGLAALHTAFTQAVQARQLACLTGRPLRHGDPPAPQGKSAPNVPGAVEQIVQLLGRNDAAQACQILAQLLLWAQNGLIAPEGFENAIAATLDGIAATYTVFPGVAGQVAPFYNCWQSPGIYTYYEALCAWMEAFGARLASGEENENQHKIHKAVQYLRTNFADEVNMAVVSNRLSMNYSQFSSLFKKYTGCNFGDYLRALRIAHAKELLRGTNLTIRQVGEASGFRNEKHFMRSFKQAVAVSPGSYRHNFRAHGEE